MWPDDPFGLATTQQLKMGRQSLGCRTLNQASGRETEHWRDGGGTKGGQWKGRGGERGTGSQWEEEKMDGQRGRRRRRWRKESVVRRRRRRRRGDRGIGRWSGMKSGQRDCRKWENKKKGHKIGQWRGGRRAREERRDGVREAKVIKWCAARQGRDWTKKSTYGSFDCIIEQSHGYLLRSFIVNVSGRLMSDRWLCSSGLFKNAEIMLSWKEKQGDWGGWGDGG